MHYTIVETFSPNDGDQWTSYCEWRGIEFSQFDSIDGMLRPALFNGPENDNEWDYVLQEHFMLQFIKEHSFAVTKIKEIGKGIIVGVKCEKHDATSDDFLGYELLDSYYDVSLLTNWGNDHSLINESISENGLVKSFETIQRIKNDLVSNYSEDAHAQKPNIISIYKVNKANQKVN